MKKFYAYLLISALVLTAFTVIPVYADEAAEGSKNGQNFEYVIPMNNSNVSIHYDAGIIIAVYRSTEWPEKAGWITTDTYGVFDLNGKTIVDYGVYDYLYFSENIGYIRAEKDGGVFLLDTSGKKVKLADGEKFTDILVWADNWYCIEGGDYFKLKNDKVKREIKIPKKSVLTSEKEDRVFEVTQLTDDFIVFNTKISTVVFSKDGKLIYNFEKMKYRSSEEVDHSFDNPTSALRFNEKGYAGYRDEKRLCGVADIYGNVIIKPAYQNLGLEGDDINAKKNGKWGVIDIDGNIIIDFKYDGAERIAEDIFTLKNNDKTRLVNLKDPDMFKDIDYDTANYFIPFDFRRIVIEKGGKYGLVSFDGELIASPEYDFMDYDYAAHDGMIKVGIKESGYVQKYGFIDMDGNVKVPVIYSEAIAFSEGLCGVVYRERGKGEYSAFVNKNGEEVLRLDKDVWVFYNSMFSEGLCAVRRGTEENGGDMFGKCEYIDKTGKTVISGGDWANDGGRFKNGLATVSSNVSGAPNVGSGFWGTDGVIRYTGGALESPVAGDTSRNWKYIVPYCKYDHCEILSNGLIKIGTRVGWDYWAGDNAPPDPVLLYGLLNHEGKPLTEIIYNSIGEPNADGYMLAAVKNGEKTKDILFDETGKILPTPENSSVTLFSHSYSVETDDAFTLYVNKKSYKIAKSVLTKSGVHLKDENDLRIHKVSAVYSNGFVISRDYGDRTAFMFNWDGTLRYKTDKYISSTPDGFILMNEYANYMLVDFDGKELIPAVYGRQIYALGDSTTYEYVHGFYTYKTGLFDWSIRDINNPKAFSGIKFDGGISYCDIKSKTIQLSNDDQTHGLYGFDGTEILPFKYINIGKVSEGLVWFQTKDNKCGFANMKGEIVFESNYCYSGYWSWVDFSEGLAGYKTADGCGFMDHDFEPVIELGEGWEIRSGFQNGVAAVAYKGEILFINREGTVVIAQEQNSTQPPWQYTQGFTGGLAAVAAHEPYARQHGSIRHEQDGVIAYTGNIPSGWAVGEVNEAVEFGIVPEDMRDLYKNEITRKEFAYIAVKYLESKKVKFSNLYKENIFRDTNDRYVNTAYALGIVNGYEDGTFKPNDRITRQEAAAMLMRTYRLYAATPDTFKSNTDYTDKNKIAAWAAEGVALMNFLGVMKGEEGNRFNPNGSYTREQSYITFLRMFKATK